MILRVPSQLIRISDSRFNFGQWNYSPQNIRPLRGAIPIMAWKDDYAGTYHLLDGYKRFLSACSHHVVDSKLSAEGHSGETELYLLPPISNSEMAELLFYSHSRFIGENSVNKVQFALWLDGFSIPKEEIISRFFPLLDLGPTAEIYRRIHKISELPPPVLAYGAQKNLSIKHLYRLTRFPSALLMDVLVLNDHEPLSPSNYMTILEFLYDDYRRSGRDWNEVMNSRSIAQIKAALHDLKTPTLTSVNTEIERKVHSMGLPSNVGVNWDKTLENKAVTITLTLESGDDYQSALNVLSEARSVDILSDIMEYL